MENIKKAPCPICKGLMDVLNKRMVGDTEYDIMQCQKCHHTVARSTE